MATSLDPPAPDNGTTPKKGFGPVALLVGAVMALVVAGVLYRGCAIEPVDISDSPEETRARVNPWPQVLTDLRRQGDPAGSRAALDRLNGALAFQESPELLPATLPAEDARSLAETFTLTEAEVNELRPSAYTPLDGQYLAYCLFLRDVVRSLDPAKRPVPEQAQLLFDLVNRQVVDQPWVRQQGNQAEVMPPVPSTAVLNRGSGSAYERGLLFLALVRQLDLDGCFVGTPDAASGSWETRTDPSTLPTGPMWAVGVRHDGDVLLFDPVRQRPFPGTLAQLLADPNLLRPWRDDPKSPLRLTDEQLKSSRLYPFVELSALAPRMVKLQQELRADVPPVQLAAAWPALVERFRTTGREVAAWASGNPFAPVRTLSSFVPSAEGGYAPAPDLVVSYQLAQIPQGLLARSSPLAASERLRGVAVNRYGVTFIEAPSPKSRVARGQFSEVVPRLVASLREFQAAQDRLRTDKALDPRVIDKFFQDLNAIAAKRRLARDKEGDTPGPLAAEAQQQEEQLLKSRAAIIEKLLDQSIAEVGAAEATYLIALAMHEQAERAQARRGKGETQAATRRAWTEARGWWERYEPYQQVQDRAFPGRADHATTLRARAAQLAGS